MQGVHVEFIGAEWERKDDLTWLLYEVLYRDFGVSIEHDWRQEMPGSLIAVALAGDGALLGAARLLPAPGDARRQVRQLAVLPGAQSQGVGRALMEALEARAAEEGATEIWLHARDTAFAFYERLGYEFTSEIFVSELTGIPHRTMRKALAQN